jgi:outer membrane protein OmpA-like peptidoglycan-associated protein
MSDSPFRIVSKHGEDKSEGSDSEHREPTQDEMAELRRLLVEREQTQINNILERLNNPRIRAREISRSLPEAIHLRGDPDEALTRALTPTVVTAFQNSVKKDPRPVVEAIFPVMGPAIRRAISSALNGAVQSLDQTLKYSLSWRGWRWRLEAWRTGKSFAEVVLYHTLIYRVEQVFLIHKKTGLLLQHAAAGTISTQDADIVSGMLTAIQDAIHSFARDSFGSGQDEPIEKLDLGDLEVWFEAGPYAVLAVVIRGKAPESLRNFLLAPAIEAIHQSDALEHFDGDTAPFENVRHYLESCLQSSYDGRYQERGEPATFKIPSYIWIITALVLSALGVWIYLGWRDQRRWDDYLSKLRSIPGIVIIETGKRDGQRFISGLRDPLSESPDEILRQQTPIDPKTVVTRWERYQALEPGFVEQRARNILKPPPEVELKIDNGILKAAGSAPHQWIADARKLAPAIPGVEEFDERDLIDEDLKEPQRLQRQIEQRVIRFIVGSTQLVPGQNRELNDLVSEMRNLISLAPAARRGVHLQITGHTDSEGTGNLRLSQERASRVLTLLAARGIDKVMMSTIGAGAGEPLRREINAADRQANRRVSFKVSLFEPQHNQIGGR